MTLWEHNIYISFQSFKMNTIPLRNIGFFHVTLWEHKITIIFDKQIKRHIVQKI